MYRATKYISITVVIFQAWNICSYLKDFWRMGKELNSQNSLLHGKLYWLSGSVLISEVDALLFVVLSKAKKVIIGAIRWYIWMCSVFSKLLHWSHYNQVQLYFSVKSLACQRSKYEGNVDRHPWHFTVLTIHHWVNLLSYTNVDCVSHTAVWSCPATVWQTAETRGISWAVP